jgi:hypothetical protein
MQPTNKKLAHLIDYRGKEEDRCQGHQKMLNMEMMETSVWLR